ncbi:RNA polymerase sigma-70 factor (ECF subfamily) [Flavobacterium sp. 270]|uniref:sigma-70 family RNA polymerase sigma factor n=1 Tax=Flavobacterium sp. 270 TaxID=2512114 RepID=UPI0010652AC7|nr:sigma-70 family RNA polymerase sigma factor [Flavobacterium sp. 270]TDW48119.1 RNA polymerase sigma-70 factor (ECF subfamily) [Flavobacterium sp. 270]
MKINEQYSDTDIIDKIVQGEFALFEILIRRYNPYLYKIGRSYNYNHEDTQDLMQEAFISVYTNLIKFEKRSTFKTWIIKIMLNCCYKKQQKFSSKNEVLKNIKNNAIPVFSGDQNTDTNKIIMNKELGHIIETALSQVPKEYRVVFSLREINGLNISETADVLNISESNVKVRLNRAKTMLRKEIEKSYTSAEIFEFNLIYCNEMVDRVMGKLQALRE